MRHEQMKSANVELRWDCLKLCIIENTCCNPPRFPAASSESRSAEYSVRISGQ